MKTSTKTPPTKPTIHMVTDKEVLYWFGIKGSTASSTIQHNDDGELFYLVNGKAEYLPKSLQLI